MASQVETPATGSFIYSEADGTRSRENIVIASGSGVLPAGRMLGKVTVGGKYANYNDGLANGTEVCAGILYAEVDATSADQTAVVIVRDAEVVSARVSAANSGHKAAGITDLAVNGILFR